MLADERVLVTGGSGFIGRAVVDLLSRHGAEVVVADLDPHPDMETVEGDLRDPAVRARALTGGTTAVVHLAAMTSVLRSKERPSEVYDTNLDMTAGLLELARQHGTRRFYLASTNAVVGDVGRDTITEETPLRPLTPYGATKAAGEMLLSAYMGSYGMSTASLRLTNVYGPRMLHKDSFVPRLMRAALEGGGVHIYGDGLQVRDLVHVDDVCQGLLKVWQAEATGPVIIGRGRSVSVLDLVAAARTATGVDIRAEHVAPKPGEMPAVIVSVDRARQLGYEPRYDLTEGMQDVWQDFQSRAGQAVR